MSQHQRLLTMHAMLDFVANEASRGGDSLVSSLAGAADEAILQQIAQANRPLIGQRIPLGGEIVASRRGNNPGARSQVTRSRA
jgi:hypothetical protein